MASGNKATLTPKQKQFVKDFYEDNMKIATPEYVYKGMMSIYLQADESSKAYAAWLIRKLKPQYTRGIEELVDIDQLNTYADAYQAIKQRATRLAQKRRHQKKEDFSLTDEEWIETIEYFECECAYCGAKPKTLTYDHFKPFSKGGKFDKNNIIPACKACNSSKNNKEFEEWYPKQPFYSKERQKRIHEYLREGDINGC